MKTEARPDRGGFFRETYGASNWLMGCSIAAAVAVVLLIVAGVGLYKVAKQGIGRAQVQISEEFEKDYVKWNDEKKIPEAQAKVFSDLRDMTKRSDASFWSVLLCFGIASSTLEDGKVTDAEAKSLEDVSAFVSAHPGASMMDFSTFFQAHPDIKMAFESAQRTHTAEKPEK